jgi:hypothetical protein
MATSVRFRAGSFSLNGARTMVQSKSSFCFIRSYSLLSIYELLSAASYVASARRVRIRLRPSTVMTCRLSHSITIQLP